MKPYAVLAARSDVHGRFYPASRIKTYDTYQGRIGWPFARQSTELLGFVAGSLCVKLKMHNQVR